jgi:hypothetical protein
VQLPFSESAFLDVFAAYNRALWPLAVTLWVATCAAAIQLLRRRAGTRAVVTLLVVHWAWSGIVYHALFFTRVNPAARLFAALFVTQAAAFAWSGLARHRLAFTAGREPRHYLGAMFVAYALAYPMLILATGHALPRAPTFGVPCPTTLLTAGLLLMAAPPVPRWVLVIPILWAVIGGSAALVLSVTPDLMLFAAGAAMLACAIAPQALGHQRAVRSPRPPGARGPAE